MSANDSFSENPSHGIPIEDLSVGSFDADFGAISSTHSIMNFRDSPVPEEEVVLGGSVEVSGGNFIPENPDEVNKDEDIPLPLISNIHQATYLEEDPEFDPDQLGFGLIARGDHPSSIEMVNSKRRKGARKSLIGYRGRQVVGLNNSVEIGSGELEIYQENDEIGTLLHIHEPKGAAKRKSRKAQIVPQNIVVGSRISGLSVHVQRSTRGRGGTGKRGTAGARQLLTGKWQPQPDIEVKTTDGTFTTSGNLYTFDKSGRIFLSISTNFNFLNRLELWKTV